MIKNIDENYTGSAMEKQIKVLLLTGYHDTAIMYSVVSPPIGLFRLQHYLEKRGISCDVLDLGLTAPDINDEQNENIETNFGEYEKLIDKGHYDVIGMSVDQENMSYTLEILWDLRLKINKLKKRCLLLAGGQAATHNYKQWIIEGTLDAVLLGFAENSLLNFCQEFARKPEVPIDMFARNISGIVYQDEQGKFVRNPSSILTEEEFRELNFTEPMETDIPYHKYWGSKDAKNAGEVLNLKKNT